MKEEDFVKKLDGIIIDGLTKEAEQDNADFEAAMRNLSDEDFDEIIFEAVPLHHSYCSDDDYEPEKVNEYSNMNRECRSFDKEIHFQYSEAHELPDLQQRSRENEPSRRWLRPWVVAALSVIAVILLVIIVVLLSHFD